MTVARRRNRLTTHFSERIPVVKRRISVFEYLMASLQCPLFTNIRFKICSLLVVFVMIRQDSVLFRRWYQLLAHVCIHFQRPQLHVSYRLFLGTWTYASTAVSFCQVLTVNHNAPALLSNNIHVIRRSDAEGTQRVDSANSFTHGLHESTQN